MVAGSLRTEWRSHACLKARVRRDPISVVGGAVPCVRRDPDDSEYR